MAETHRHYINRQWTNAMFCFSVLAVNLILLY